MRGRDLSSVTPDESMRLSLANDIAILSLLRGRALHLCGDIPGSESTLRAANIALRNELALCNPDMPRPGGHRVLVQSASGNARGAASRAGNASAPRVWEY